MIPIQNLGYLSIGDLVDLPSGGGKSVLMVVLSDPNSNPVLLARVARQDGLYPNPCVIYAGEHPWIKNDSYVDFARVAPKAPGELSQAVSWNDNVVIAPQPLPQDVLQRIWNDAAGEEDFKDDYRAILDLPPIM